MEQEFINRILNPAIVMDTRELSSEEWERTHLAPIPFSDHIRLVRDTLPVGDYGIPGMSDMHNPHFIVETKRSDIPTIILKRFDRELLVMRKFKYPFILLGAVPPEIEAGDLWSQMNPDSIFGKVASIRARLGIQVEWVGDYPLWYEWHQMKNGDASPTEVSNAKRLLDAKVKLNMARAIELLAFHTCRGIVEDVRRLERATRVTPRERLPRASGKKQQTNKEAT